MRIAHLIQNGVDPFNILALTLPIKAAREMKERIARVVGDSDAKSIWIGTFPPYLPEYSVWKHIILGFRLILQFMIVRMH